MEIGGIHLERKSGGEEWKLYSGGGERMNYRVAVLTLSDKGARGVRKDRSGPAVAELGVRSGI